MERKAKNLLRSHLLTGKPSLRKIAAELNLDNQQNVYSLIREYAQILAKKYEKLCKHSK
jgi:hypothetical protein